MKKIISVFARNYEGDHLVRDEVVSGAEWVLAGEGIATRKWDGTACLVRDGKLWKRYDAKRGKTPPEGWEAAQEPDPVTGHWPGWVRVDASKPEDRWFMEAYERHHLVDGTWELIGPKIGANPEKVESHTFRKHGDMAYDDVPRDFVGMRDWLSAHAVEGLVFHHPDGRTAKIKRRDFGLEWPVR